jgi:hypothetical protein
MATAAWSLLTHPGPLVASSGDLVSLFLILSGCILVGIVLANLV